MAARADHDRWAAARRAATALPRTVQKRVVAAFDGWGVYIVASIVKSSSHAVA